MGIFEVVMLCLFSFTSGILIMLLIRYSIEIYFVNKDIKELEEQIKKLEEKNSKETDTQ